MQKNCYVLFKPVECLHYFLASSCNGLSGDPNFSYKTGPGALAPKVSTPMDLPLSPTHFSHPKVLPASILTRAVTDDGKIDSLYSSLCASKISQHGIEITRTLFPS